MIYSVLLTISLSFFSIMFIIHYAEVLNLVDQPNERSTHQRIIPLGAGIGFILSMIIGIMNYDISIILQNWHIFASVIFVLAVGIIDDIYHADPKVKIIIISLAALLLSLNNLNITNIGSYMGHYISLGWLSIPFTVFVVVAFTNSFNLLDGIDGLAGIASFVIISSFWYIGFLHKDILIVTISAFTLVSILPFILLNHHPAKIFMGDSGSLSLGLIISILAILSLAYIHPIVILFLTILPLYDTLTVVTRRIKNNMPIFKPDKTHMHHILLGYFGDRDIEGKRIKGSRRTVGILISFQLLGTVTGYWINSMIQLHPLLPFIAVIIFIMGFLFIYKLFTKIDNL